MNTEPTLPPDDAGASREDILRWADRQCINPPPEYTNEDGSIDWGRLVADKGVLPVTITDGGAGTMKAPHWAANLPYVLHKVRQAVPDDISEGPAPLTTYLEYLSTIKTVFATLKANGTHKQAGIALGLLSANWLGGMLYHMVPFSGVPMTVGMLCLCSLVLRSNRERLVKVIKDYVE